MITAPQILKSLLEEYHSGHTANGNYVEVFKNPSLLEMRKLGDKIRFIADPSNHKVYVWDARLALHHDIERKIGNFDNLDYKILSGEADWKQPAYHINQASHIQTIVDNPRENVDYMEPAAQLLDDNWGWLDKYFKGSSAYTSEKLEDMKDLLVEYSSDDDWDN
jgi:hypothetical protein